MPFEDVNSNLIPEDTTQNGLEDVFSAIASIGDSDKKTQSVFSELTKDLPVFQEPELTEEQKQRQKAEQDRIAALNDISIATDVDRPLSDNFHILTKGTTIEQLKDLNKPYPADRKVKFGDKEYVIRSGETVQPIIDKLNLDAKKAAEIKGNQVNTELQNMLFKITGSLSTTKEVKETVVPGDPDYKVPKLTVPPKPGFLSGKVGIIPEEPYRIKTETVEFPESKRTVKWRDGVISDVDKLYGFVKELGPNAEKSFWSKNKDLNTSLQNIKKSLSGEDWKNFQIEKEYEEALDKGVNRLSKIPLIGLVIPPFKEEAAFNKLRFEQGKRNQAFGPEIEMFSNMVSASIKLGASYNAFVGYAGNVINIPFVSGETYSAKNLAIKDNLRKMEQLSDKYFGSLEARGGVGFAEKVKDGRYFDATLQFLSDIPPGVAAQFPQLAAMYITGGLTAQAGLATRLSAQAAVVFPQHFSETMTRSIENSKTLDASVLKSLAASAANTALDVMQFEFVFGKLFRGGKVKGFENMTLAELQNIKDKGLLQKLVKELAKYSGSELPTEVLQQMSSRAAAGLNLWDRDAIREYIDTAYAVLTAAPLGLLSFNADQKQAKQTIDYINFQKDQLIELGKFALATELAVAGDVVQGYAYEPGSLVPTPLNQLGPSSFMFQAAESATGSNQTTGLLQSQAQTSTTQSASNSFSFSMVPKPSEQTPNFTTPLVTEAMLPKLTGDQQAQANKLVEGGMNPYMAKIQVLGPDGLKAAYETFGGVALEGMPTLDAKTGLPILPYGPAQQSSYTYMTSNGIQNKLPFTYRPVNIETAQEIAKAYEQMPNILDDSVWNSTDPKMVEYKNKVLASYNALAAETLQQFNHILKSNGTSVEFYPVDANGNVVDPYGGNPRNALMDLMANNHLYVYPTSAGFGTTGISETDTERNPMLKESGVLFGDKKATMNDVFRFVHDYYGHMSSGTGFRSNGEENAWRHHSVMYSPLARMAMTSETRGQNSWTNYNSKSGKLNQNATQETTQYAEQKLGILPDWIHQLDSDLLPETTQGAQFPNISERSFPLVPQSRRSVKDFEKAIKDILTKLSGDNFSSEDVSNAFTELLTASTTLIKEQDTILNKEPRPISGNVRRGKYKLLSALEDAYKQQGVYSVEDKETSFPLITKKQYDAARFMIENLIDEKLLDNIGLQIVREKGKGNGYLGEYKPVLDKIILYVDSLTNLNEDKLFAAGWFESTFNHELFHGLTKFLPNNVKQSIAAEHAKRVLLEIEKSIEIDKNLEREIELAEGRSGGTRIPFFKNFDANRLRALRDVSKAKITYLVSTIAPLHGMYNKDFDTWEAWTDLENKRSGFKKLYYDNAPYGDPLKILNDSTGTKNADSEYSYYQFINADEFFAVNGDEIVASLFMASQDPLSSYNYTGPKRVLYDLFKTVSNFYEMIKNYYGFKSDYAFTQAFKALKNKDKGLDGFISSVKNQKTDYSQMLSAFKFDKTNYLKFHRYIAKNPKLKAVIDAEIDIRRIFSRDSEILDSEIQGLDKYVRMNPKTGEVFFSFPDNRQNGVPTFDEITTEVWDSNSAFVNKFLEAINSHPAFSEPILRNRLSEELRTSKGVSRVRETFIDMLTWKNTKGQDIQKVVEDINKGIGYEFKTGQGGTKNNVTFDPHEATIQFARQYLNSLTNSQSGIQTELRDVNNELRQDVEAEVSAVSGELNPEEVFVERAELSAQGARTVAFDYMASLAESLPGRFINSGELFEKGIESFAERQALSFIVGQYWLIREARPKLEEGSPESKRYGQAYSDLLFAIESFKELHGKDERFSSFNIDNSETIKSWLADPVRGRRQIVDTYLPKVRAIFQNKLSESKSMRALPGFSEKYYGSEDGVKTAKRTQAAEVTRELKKNLQRINEKFDSDVEALRAKYPESITGGADAFLGFKGEARKELEILRRNKKNDIKKARDGAEIKKQDVINKKERDSSDGERFLNVREGGPRGESAETYQASLSNPNQRRGAIALGAALWTVRVVSKGISSGNSDLILNGASAFSGMAIGLNAAYDIFQSVIKGKNQNFGMGDMRPLHTLYQQIITKRFLEAIDSKLLFDFRSRLTLNEINLLQRAVFEQVAFRAEKITKELDAIKKDNPGLHRELQTAVTKLFNPSFGSQTKLSPEQKNQIRNESITFASLHLSEKAIEGLIYIKSMIGQTQRMYLDAKIDGKPVLPQSHIDAITETMDDYLPTIYRAFVDKEAWLNDAGFLGRRNKLKSELMSNSVNKDGKEVPGLSESEAETFILKYENGIMPPFKYTIGAELADTSRGNAGRIENFNEKSSEQRKKISLALSNFLSPVDNPLEAVAHKTREDRENIAALERSKFAVDWLLKNGLASAEKKDGFEQIKAVGAENNPYLSSVYFKKEIIPSLVDVFIVSNPALLGDALGSLVSTVKAMQTLTNPDLYIIQGISNIFLGIVHGDVSPISLHRLVAAISLHAKIKGADLLGLSVEEGSSERVLAYFSGLSKEDLSRLIQISKEKGIFSDSASVADITDYFKGSEGKDLQWIMKKFGTVYGFTDTLLKFNAFMERYLDVSKIRPNASIDENATIASEMVARLYPSPHYTPQLLKTLSKYGIARVAPYVVFTSEIIRNTMLAPFHYLALAQEYPELKAYAGRKVAWGLISGTALVTLGVEALGKLLGDDDDDDKFSTATPEQVESLKQMNPDDPRFKNPMSVKISKDGRIKFVETQQLNPFSFQHNVYGSFVSYFAAEEGSPEEAAALKDVRSSFGAFITSDETPPIGLRFALAMMGYEVRRDGSMVPSGVPGETGLSGYEEKALFMFRNFLTPALVSKAQRLQKSISEDESERYNPATGVNYDFAREAQRTVGIREYEASVDVMFARRVRDFTGKFGDLKKDMSSSLIEVKSGENINSNFNSYQEKFSKDALLLKASVNAAMNLGMNKSEVIEGMRKAGIEDSLIIEFMTAPNASEIPFMNAQEMARAGINGAFKFIDKFSNMDNKFKVAAQSHLGAISASMMARTVDSEKPSSVDSIPFGFKYKDYPEISLTLGDINNNILYALSSMDNSKPLMFLEQYPIYEKQDLLNQLVFQRKLNLAIIDKRLHRFDGLNPKEIPSIVRPYEDVLFSQYRDHQRRIKSTNIKLTGE